MAPAFYLTVHPVDTRGSHLLPGGHVMVVASAHWNDRSKRFTIHRQPSDIGGLAVDCGGSTAARR
jgi:hypothetical protein